MKKIIALSIAATFIAPTAYADTVNVNIYGRLRAAVEGVNGAGAPAGKNGERQVRVVDNQSILGIKGAEDLGGDLIVNWQAEGTLEADGDSDGRLNSRNTFVALKHAKYGTLLAGQFDTPYKVATRFIRDSVLSDTTGDVGAITGHGLGQNFYTRQKSTVQYHSPNWSGFDFRVGYAPDEAKTSSKNNARVSLSAGYENDIAFVVTGYETRSDTTGTESADAVELFGGTKLGKKGNVTLGVERLSLADNDQTNYFLGSTYRVTDAIALSAHVARAGKSGNAADTAATQFGLGAQYEFSKRTSVVAYYAQINNQGQASYNFVDNPIDSLVKGNDPKVAGVGVNHKF